MSAGIRRDCLMAARASVPEQISEAVLLLRTLTFPETLDRADDLDAFAGAVARLVGSFGLEYFMFQDFPDPNSYADSVFCRRIPDEWFKLYIKQNYVRISPAYRFLKQTTQPFMWADAPYDAEREPRVLEFLHRVADFGLDCGVMIPTPGHQTPRRRVDGRAKGGTHDRHAAGA